MTLRLARLAALVLTGVVAGGSWIPTAAASNGRVSSAVRSANGGGAYVSAQLAWVGSDEYRLSDVYVNDRCNAKGRDDGLAGVLRVWIKRSSGNVVSQVYGDLGGCRSAPFRATSLRWQGALPIDAAGVQACVGRADKAEVTFRGLRCGPISWRVNHRA